MMTQIKQYTKGWVFLTALLVFSFSSCKKDGNPNNLPGVSAGDYSGKIDGFIFSTVIEMPAGKR